MRPASLTTSRSLVFWGVALFCALLFGLTAADRAEMAAQAVTYTLGVAPCDTTLQACLNAADHGDTILIPAGTYTESLTLDKAVNLTGADRATTIISAAANQRVLTITGAAISNTVISGLTFTGGRALNDHGGGVKVSGLAEPTLDHVAITNNFTAYSGGGLINSSVMTLTNSIVAYNVAQGSGGGGGVWTGCLVGNCRIYISDTTISNNIVTALPSYGAGLYNAAVAELVNVTIHTNNGRQGAGLANFEPTSVMTVTNATITKNGFSALPFSNYSAILNFGTLTLVNATISGNGNFAVTTNGGIWNASSSGAFTLRNTIVADNIGGNCGYTSIPFVNDGGNLQSGPDTGCVANSGELPAGDSRLYGLANQGGPTQTMALATGSAAIDAGVSAYCPITDQRGALRSSPCDSGAFERTTSDTNLFLPLIRR